jgi:hypothetical protein
VELPGLSEIPDLLRHLARLNSATQLGAGDGRSSSCIVGQRPGDRRTLPEVPSPTGRKRETQRTHKAFYTRQATLSSQTLEQALFVGSETLDEQSCTCSDSKTIQVGLNEGAGSNDTNKSGFMG